MRAPRRWPEEKNDQPSRAALIKCVLGALVFTFTFTGINDAIQVRRAPAVQTSARVPDCRDPAASEALIATYRLVDGRRTLTDCLIVVGRHEADRLP